MSLERLRWKPTGTAWRLAFVSLGLAGAAVNTGNNLLYLLLGLLLSSVPVAVACAWLNLSGIEVEPCAPRRVLAGTAWTIELRLRRRQRFAARGFAVQVTTTRRAFRPAWVERLAGHGTLGLTLPGDRLSRGVERIEGVTLRSTFPLGILERTVPIVATGEILILPRAERGAVRAGGRTAPLAGGPVPSRRASGNEYDGTRPGGDREDLRRIDWKATARHGSLMLREVVEEGAPHVEIDLATRLAVVDGPALERFEDDVARAAGAASRVLQEGGGVRLTVNGREAQSWSGPAGIVPLLSRLARLTPTDTDGRPAPRERLPCLRPAREMPAAGSGGPPERVHRQSVFAALVVGVVALFAYDGIGVPAFAAIAASLGWLALGRKRAIARPGGVFRTLWNIAAVVTLVVFLAGLIISQNPLWASIYLIVFIALYLIFNADTPLEDRLVLFTSMAQIVLSAALTTDVSFALPLVAWVVLGLHAQAAWTSMPPQRIGPLEPALFEPQAPAWRYASHATLVACAMGLVGLALFAVIPHVGTGSFDPGAGRAQARTGFSDSARLGDIGKIKLDRRPVMEVAVEGAPGTDDELKWRGAALDTFDGRNWTRAPSAVEWFTVDGGTLFEDGEGELLVQEIRLEPVEKFVLFAAERPISVFSPELRVVARDGAGTLEARPWHRGRLDYVVTSRTIPRDAERLRQSAGEESSELLARNLGLPELDSRIPALAQRIVADRPTRYDAARAIEDWVSTHHEYSLDVRDGGLADPLAAFLFDGMAGHCEYFATGMVVLARAAGIPARFVTGYLRGDTNRFSRRYLVRQSDAHSWVEVHFPGVGWVPFDPTPSVGRALDRRGLGDLLSDLHATVSRWWDDHLVGVDLNDQYQALLSARDLALRAFGNWRSWAWIALGPLASWLALVAWRRTRSARGADARAPLPVFYRKLLVWLARRGLQRLPAETPAELARRASVTLAPDEASCVSQLTDLYYRVRFGHDHVEADVRTRASSLLAALER